VGNTSSTFTRVMKPLLAGLALAYCATAFVDKPAPVNFQPENPYAAKQAEIVEPEISLVLEKNIMKLGSPLSVRKDETQVKGAAKQDVLSVGDIVEEAISSANATAP